VRTEASPDVRDSDELHDVLLSLIATRPCQEWSEHFEALASAGRAFEVRTPDVVDVLWAATERRALVEALFPGAKFMPDHPLPAALFDEVRLYEHGAVKVCKVGFRSRWSLYD
jgi:hypothetical protein